MFLNDEYLLFLLRRQKQEAFQVLYLRYIAYAYSYLRQNFNDLNNLLSYDELASTLRQAFFVSISRFEFNSGYLYPYFIKVLRSHFFNALRTKKSSKSVEHSYIMLSLDQKIFDEYETKTFHDLIYIDDEFKDHFNSVNILDLTLNEKGVFTRLEKEILMYYLDGYKSVEIASALKMSVKKVRTIIKKLKERYKKLEDIVQIA